MRNFTVDCGFCGYQFFSYDDRMSNPDVKCPSCQKYTFDNVHTTATPQTKTGGKTMSCTKKKKPINMSVNKVLGMNMNSTIKANNTLNVQVNGAEAPDLNVLEQGIVALLTEWKKEIEEREAE